MGDRLNCAIFSGEAMQMRQVLLHPGEDGYWVVECPSLPGCVTQGKSKEEALENIKEAIRGYVESLRQDGLPVPDERFDALLVAV
jgi:predicted RNase H-like HicB family nuclease